MRFLSAKIRPINCLIILPFIKPQSSVHLMDAYRKNGQFSGRVVWVIMKWRWWVTFMWNVAQFLICETISGSFIQRHIVSWKMSCATSDVDFLAGSIRRILLQCVVITTSVQEEDARPSNHVTSRPADDSGWTYDPFVGVALQYLIWHFYRRRGSGILSAPVEPVQWWADLQGGDEGVQAPTVTTVTLRGKRRSVAKRCQESYDRLPCRQPRRHHSPLTMAHPTIQPNMRVDLSPRLGGDTVANQPPPNYCPPLIHLQSSPHLLPWTV